MKVNRVQNISKKYLNQISNSIYNSGNQYTNNEIIANLKFLSPKNKFEKFNINNHSPSPVKENTNIQLNKRKRGHHHSNSSHVVTLQNTLTEKSRNSINNINYMNLESLLESEFIRKGELNKEKFSKDKLIEGKSDKKKSVRHSLFLFDTAKSQKKKFSYFQNSNHFKTTETHSINSQTNNSNDKNFIKFNINQKNNSTLLPSINEGNNFQTENNLKMYQNNVKLISKSNKIKQVLKNVSTPSNVKKTKEQIFNILTPIIDNVNLNTKKREIEFEKKDLVFERKTKCENKYYKWLLTTFNKIPKKKTFIEIYELNERNENCERSNFLKNRFSKLIQKEKDLLNKNHENKITKILITFKILEEQKSNKSLTEKKEKSKYKFFCCF